MSSRTVSLPQAPALGNVLGHYSTAPRWYSIRFDYYFPPKMSLPYFAHTRWSPRKPTHTYQVLNAYFALGMLLTAVNRSPWVHLA